LRLLDRWKDATMDRRRLGSSTIEIAPLVFGGNVFGWTADEATSFALLDAFVDAGFSAIDTADVYSRWVPGHRGGESETVIGNWIERRGRSDDIVVITKVGMDMGEDRSGLRREHIVRSVEESLSRLKRDHIDVYMAHRDDPDTPLDETLEAFSSLVDQGKVRWLAASNYDGDRLRDALDISQRRGFHRYECLEPLYNLCDRTGFETDLAPVCHDRNIGVIPYYGLASGFLTGKYRTPDDASKSPRGAGVVKKYLNDRGRRILAALDEVGERLAATPAQVSLAWLITQPGVTAPIVSATSTEQLGEIVKSAHLDLDSDALRRLDEASAL
jgi:aryl-alcohol dehydrogenase-like predicted oxidoreductase